MVFVVESSLDLLPVFSEANAYRCCKFFPFMNSLTLGRFFIAQSRTHSIEILVPSTMCKPRFKERSL